MATQTSSRYAPMQVYTSPSMPTIAGADPSRALAQELQTLQQVLASIQAMIPQAATTAPPRPVDGMQRLARAPWRPANGQSGDAWVYYDGPSNSWRLR